jgi:hypothetical protein
MHEIGHRVKESRMVACRGGRGLVGVGGEGVPGSRRLDKRLWRETGKSNWEGALGGRDGDASHIFWGM